jgi:hypothetical protein
MAVCKELTLASRVIDINTRRNELIYFTSRTTGDPPSLVTKSEKGDENVAN